MELLADIKSSLSHGPQQVASLLLQRFNDSAVSDNILYYFRLLTSAHLRAHAATYVHFIPDGLDLNSYAKEVLEPSRSEIDHVGMQLLIDVLIRPIGLPVTVIYLDRSEGDDVTPHVLQGDASGNISLVKPEAYLLYRPGHYDILYKEEDAALTGMAQRVVAGAAQASQLQIHRASIASRLEQEAPIGIGNTYDMSALSLIPGMSLAQPLSSHIFNQFSVQDSFDPMPVKFDPSPIGFNPTPIEYETKPIKYDPGVSYPIGIPMDLDTHVTAPSLSDLSSTSSIRAMTPHSATVPPMSQPFHPAAPPPTKAVKSQSLPENPVIPGSQFRPSKYEYEPDLKESIATVQQNLKTSMFKNSHYNTSHWMNPHFQPEEWTPDQEEYPLPQQRRGSKGGRGSFSK
jgi:ubiquitin thioesterase protein OTUB1